MMMAADDQSPISNKAYRPCVGICLINRRRQVWTGRRVSAGSRYDDMDIWQMPQGGIEKDEDKLSAATRELAEETGVTSASSRFQYPEELYYDLPDDLIGRALNGRFRGQRQTWFVFDFLGDDNEIDITRRNTDFQPEFEEWRWASIGSLTEHAAPFKRNIYSKLQSFLEREINL